MRFNAQTKSKSACTRRRRSGSTKTKKANQTGFLFGLFLVLLWTVRFFVEFVKEAQNLERAEWSLNTGQWLSIPFILIGLYFMFVYKPKSTIK